MKLFSAIGIEDFSNPLTVQPTTDVYRRLGFTDLFHFAGHPSFFPIPVAGRGCNFSTYSSSTGFQLKDVIAEYPTGNCWVALGIMVDPIQISGGGGTFFSVTSSLAYHAFVSMGTANRNDLIAIAGQNKRCCLELIYKPSTGQYRIYVNGIMVQSGSTSILNVGSYPLDKQMVCFNAFHQNDSTSRFYVTDCYLGVVDAIDSFLGNFKVNKLVAKTTTLNADGMTPGGAAQRVTGDHVVEFDVATLNGQVVQGVAESIRAFSVGPTAAVSTKRTINGVETAARKAANLPVISPPVLGSDDILNQRPAAPPSNYVSGTPLTECKLALSIVSN